MCAEIGMFFDWRRAFKQSRELSSARVHVRLLTLISLSL